jgi:hypothetical protein
MWHVPFVCSVSPFTAKRIALPSIMHKTIVNAIMLLIIIAQGQFRALTVSAEPFHAHRRGSLVLEPQERLHAP